ncbi:response regulator [Croceicoccus ponticola]|uniref:Response regulator n=1 Tax=Croceicoccus ponticola TaxID=2217664 RepID=A0A437GXH9_9SPHN|nr:response regulator [Croceicoccus ponticola]RVQ67094.1 response regulator [Croceicoccus ponticola]
MSTNPSPQETDHRIGTALVVEDDPILALSIEDILLGAGSPKVTVCASTRQALAALEKEKPDVLVLDVHLVDRDDGWAVAELVTQLGPQPPRIVFSTGNPGAIPPAIASLGTVLTKPYAPEALIEAVSGTRRTGLFARIKGAISPD